MIDESYRNLTEEEIKLLPLELKVCFYLCGWNKSVKIKSPEDWIETFHYLYDNREEYSTEKDHSKEFMKEEYNRLYNFIDKYIDIE